MDPMAVSDSDLTSATQLVAEARERLARQRELVQQLQEEGHDASEAEALLETMQRTAEALEEDLRQIEDETVGAKSDQG
jgi:leucyl-tRNA synthetase